MKEPKIKISDIQHRIIKKTLPIADAQNHQATSVKLANGQNISMKKTVKTTLGKFVLTMMTICVSIGITSTVQAAPLRGFNLPPVQGDSNSGAFLPGVYNWSYTNAQVKAANATFNAMRLPVNKDTANNPAALARMKGYVDQFAGQNAIIVMYGTTKTPGTHGTGFPDGLAAMGAAWAKVHAVFGSYPNVRYEIFNEPFAYDKHNPTHYVNDMKAIISYGGLPMSKCIIDGMGYADDVNLVVAGGWTGDIAYHFYPNWSSDHTQSAYSNLVQKSLGTYGNRVWITEFGANLGYNNACYETYDNGTSYWSGDVNALRGLQDALTALKAKGRGVKGAFHWHGWHNNDSYDFWAGFNANGACKVKKIQANM